jgi:hypothetical protein
MAALAAPVAVAEKIYAVARGADFALHLTRFDSGSPLTVEMSVPLAGELSWMASVSLEFDPATRTLYGFGHPGCEFDPCPPIPVFPAIIDPLSGVSENPEWPLFPGSYHVTGNLDIHPLTREIRIVGRGAENLRYSIPDLAPGADQPLNLPGWYPAVAHTPAGPGGAVQTFAVRYLDYGGENAQLVRIGGPGGDPPPSSGEVTVIGELAIDGAVRGFDISESGAAFLATYDWEVSEQNLLYAVDLESAVVAQLGVIATPDSLASLTGFAVAPLGFGTPAVAVPGLSRWGLALLASLMGGLGIAALRLLKPG